METNGFENLLRLLMYQDLITPPPHAVRQNRVRYVYLLHNIEPSAPGVEDAHGTQGAPNTTVISSSFCMN